MFAIEYADTGTYASQLSSFVGVQASASICGVCIINSLEQTLAREVCHEDETQWGFRNDSP